MTLSHRNVLSFTDNYNSGPCYVFGTFKIITVLLTVWSLIDIGETNATKASLCCPTMSTSKVPSPA
jgi:hypothetical protein